MNPFSHGGLIFFSAMCFWSQSFAQNEKIDSLKKMLASSEGVNRFETLFGLAYEYSDVNDSLSLIYSDQAYDVALKLGDSSCIIKSGRIKAGELRRLENIDKAILTAKHVLEIARRHTDTSEIKVLLNSLAISHFLKDEYDKALKYHFESLMISERQRNKVGISISLNNIALVFYKLEDWDRSIEYYKKALEFKKKANDNFDLDRLLINLGLCFIYKGEYKEAEGYITNALNACGEKCSDQILLEGKMALGMVYYKKESYPEAIRYFERSYEIAKRSGNYRSQADNLICFARVYLIQKEYQLMAKCLQEAENIAVAKGDRFLLVSTYALFSELYNHTKDYKSAAMYMSKYIAIKDSISGKKVLNRLAQLRTEHEQREYISIISEKNQLLLLKEELLRKQKVQTILLITGLILFIFFLVKYKSRLLKLELDDQLKSEKERIAQDLHDNIGSRLVSLSLGLNHMIKEYDIESSTAEQIYDNVNSTVTELRDTIWAIQKEGVTIEEFCDKLRNLVWRLKQNNSATRYDLQIKTDDDYLVLKPTQAINLYRIVQEAIANSQKHSEANLLVMKVFEDKTNHSFCIRIEDDGKGFDLHNSQMNDHYGLKNMGTRAEEIDALFEISTQSGRGTAVLVSLPLPGNN